MTNDFTLKPWQQQWSCPFSLFLFHKTNKTRMAWKLFMKLLLHFEEDFCNIPRWEQFHKLFSSSLHLTIFRLVFPSLFCFAKAEDKSLKRKFALILLETEIHVSWFFLVEARSPWLLSTFFSLSILIYVCLWNCSCIIKCSHVFNFSPFAAPHSRRFKAQ